MDFDLHAEFLLPRGVNSGVFLRGCYEVQLLDDPDHKETPLRRCGAIWGEIPATRDAYRGPSQWNTLDVRLVGRTVTVKLNGTTVIDAATLTRPTESGKSHPEGVPGPLVLQNFPKDVQFKNIWVTPR